MAALYTVSRQIRLLDHGAIRECRWTRTAALASESDGLREPSDRAWDELGCTCGAGEPCKCNETGGVDEPDVGQVIIEDGPGATSRLASWRAAEVYK
jgi:hypothetical protein